MRGKGRYYTPELSRENDCKILVAVGGNTSRTDGTVIRAKRVYALLAERFNVELYGFKKFSTTMPGWQLLLFSPFWLLDQIALIFKKRFDYVYCCNNRFGFLVFKVFQPFFRYRLAYEAHSVISDEMRSMQGSALSVKINELLESFIASHCDRVVALSEHTASFFRRHRGKVEMIPVFVDTDAYKPDPVKRAEIRAKHHVSANTLLVGMIGPFDIVFNHYYLSFLKNNLDQFAEGVQIVMIGNCIERLENTRIIYTGYVEDYAAYLAALDCVLVPADFPTGGPRNKIIEPMSVGLTVFSTPHGSANLDYAQNGENIFIVEEKDLISRINRFARDHKEDHTGKNARNMIEKYYSYKACRTKLYSVFEPQIAALSRDHNSSRKQV